MRLAIEFRVDDFCSLLGVRCRVDEVDRPETSDSGREKRRAVAPDIFFSREVVDVLLRGVASSPGGASSVGAVAGALVDSGVAGIADCRDRRRLSKTMFAIAAQAAEALSPTRC